MISENAKRRHLNSIITITLSRRMQHRKEDAFPHQKSKPDSSVAAIFGDSLNPAKNKIDSLLLDLEAPFRRIVFETGPSSFSVMLDAEQTG
jgi:hypothetical protein